MLVKAVIRLTVLIIFLLVAFYALKDVPSLLGW